MGKTTKEQKQEVREEQESHECIDLFYHSFMEKLSIRWQTRDLGQKIDVIIILLSVSIYYDKLIYEQEFDAALQAIKRYVKNEKIAHQILERIKLRIEEYIKNESLFEHDKESVIEMIEKDIQLYTIMLDVFNSDGDMCTREKGMERLIKNKYDELYKLEENKGYSKEWK